jgi:RNA polymerase sigma-70 factor (ECF subfamily)
MFMDRIEFETHWRRSEPRVRAFLASSCSDGALVLDLVQETALAAWRKRDQFDPDRDFLAWVIGMARFVLLRNRRDLARRRVFLAPELVEQLAEQLVTETAVLDTRQAALAVCREQLGEPAQRLLALRLGEELPLAEVAKRLGRTHGAVRTAFSRVRDWLRACIEKRLAGESMDATLTEDV